MAEPDAPRPGGSEEKSTDKLRETLVQSDEALAKAKDTTGAAGVVPSATAPKISGYTLTTLLGQGAFAQVWKAKQERTGKMVAIKVFIPCLSG